MGEDCPTAVLQCDSAASRESVVLFVTPGCFQARATPARSGSSLALRRGRGGGFCGVAAPRFLVPSLQADASHEAGAKLGKQSFCVRRCGDAQADPPPWRRRKERLDKAVIATCSRAYGIAAYN